MEYFGDRNVGLDGVLAQVPNYEKSGFKICHSVSNYIFPGSNEVIDDENITENIRLENRFIDLRRDQMQKNLKVRF